MMYIFDQYEKFQLLVILFVEMGHNDKRILLTDNVTLTDASIAFHSIEKGLQVSESIYLNWLKFLENIVLYDEVVTDEKVFTNQTWIQDLKQKIGIISPIQIGQNLRFQINNEADTILKILDSQTSASQDHSYGELSLNQAQSNLKRLLFYLGLSYYEDLVYSPSFFRNNLLSNILNFYELSDSKTNLENKLLGNVVAAVKDYAKNVTNESGIEMIIAELPPVSALVIDKAIKCGSWSEAIYEIRRKQIVNHFREWAQEVSLSLENGNQKTLKKLTNVNSFIKGWGESKNEGLEINVKVGIGAILKLVGIPDKINIVDMGNLSLDIPNPLPKRHLVFLSEMFKSVIRARQNLAKIQKISI